MDMQNTSNGNATTHAVNAAPRVTEEATIIKMRKPEEKVSRQSYMLEKSVAEQWKEFNKNVPYKTVTLGWAMKRFMADVKAGKIKFELEI